MVWIYPAKYRDKSGEVLTAIENDGRTLRMVVRGVEFSGPDFDGMEVTRGQNVADLSLFTLQRGELCSCVIECEIPIPVGGAEITQGVLRVRLELGNPRSEGGLDGEDLRLELTLGNSSFKSSGSSGWFEDELLEIQRQLPNGVFLKACINCDFSDYSPGGHGLFGCLACFRGNKEGYRRVTSKHGLLQIWGTLTEYVQETYLCPEFEKRLPGRGYRG